MQRHAEEMHHAELDAVPQRELPRLMTAVVFDIAERDNTHVTFFLVLRDVLLVFESPKPEQDVGPCDRWLVNKPHPAIKPLAPRLARTLHNRRYRLFGVDGRNIGDCPGQDHGLLKFDSHVDADERLHIVVGLAAAPLANLGQKVPAIVWQ